MDIADKGNDAADVFLRAALSKREPSGPMFTGVCLYCGDPVDVPARWCDEYCREDWEKTKRAERNGPLDPD